MKPFHSTSLQDYQLVSNNVNYLYQQFNQIQQFLCNRFPKSYSNLLAQPEMNGKELLWYTNLTGDVKPIDSFTSSVRRDLLVSYNAKRHEIDAICNQFELSDDSDQHIWAEILKQLFNPDHLLLFSNGIDLVFVWGIKTYKLADYSLPYDSYKFAISPINPNLLVNDPLRPDKQEEHIEETNDEDNESISNENIETANTETEVTETIVNEESENEQSMLDEEPPTEPGDNITQPPIDIQDKPIKSKNWFYRALDRFEIFASKYWWVLLILFILLLLLILNKCKDDDKKPTLSDIEVEEIYDEIMPEIPRQRLIPIDTSDFKEDDETGGIVVAGLLNLALVDKKDKFKRMAVELKNLFPSEEYKIVYFDDQTNRLQFNFPEGKESEVKNIIKTKLTEFNPLVWNESVFTGSKTCNDPFIKDTMKSWYLNAINASKAWDITMGDTSVRIAIIDDGFDLNHPEFKGKRILFPYNVTSDDKNVYGNTNIKHGTHVAGLALANADNNSGSSGIAPKCTFIPIQIGSGEEFFTMTDIVDGVLYALNHGADVINMSLGKYFGDELKSKSPGELDEIISTYGKDEERFWKELFSLAEKQNTLIVIAAGNENLPIGLDPMQRSDQVLKVVALNKNLKKANFSNYCKSCLSKNTFIAAPGVAIFSSVPGNSYESMDGTSMASPIVAGAVALMKSLKPNMKNKEILKILRETARSVPDRYSPPLMQIDKALQKIK